MRKSMLLAGTFLVFASANASASSTIMEVKVPFPFVVQGRTLPAGQYIVEEDGAAVLFRGEKDNHAAAYVMTMAASSGQNAADRRPALTFTRSENLYQLSSVRESGSDQLMLIGR